MPEGKNQRLLSLDLFRGMTVLGMVLVNNPGSWATVYPPLLHAPWHGCTPTDLVFPFFLFIVGVAIPLALQRFQQNKPQHARVLLKVGKRALWLFIIGLCLNAFPAFQFDSVRIPGVLQRIALVFGLAAIIYLKTSPKGWLIIGGSCLLGYWGLMALVPVPGMGAPNYEKATNLAAWVDQQLLAGHMWSHSKTWDPEGVLGTFTALVTALMGMGVTWWITKTPNKIDKTLGLCLGGIVIVLIGWGWGYYLPINKSLWTSTYVLFTGGIAMAVLAGFYYWADVKKWPITLFYPFKVFGVNALFAFILSVIIAKLSFRPWWPDGQSTHGLLYGMLTKQIENPYLSSFMYACGFVLVIYLPVWWLYKKKIYIKV